MKNIKTIFLVIIGIVALFATPLFLNQILDATGVVMAVGAGFVGYDRKVFELVRKKSIEKGASTPSPSFLRIEQTLSNSKSLYEFDIKKNGNEIATENKLDRNDMFVISRMGIYLLDQITAEIGKASLQTFPNQTEFASTSAFDPTDLETVYSGKLNWTIGNIVNIENLSMQEFRFVPQTQQSAATNNTQFNAVDYSYQLPTLIYASGKQNHSIKVEFPTWSGITLAAVASGHVNKLVLQLWGFLVKNWN